MNNIQNNAYALEAFPTEKMLKVFGPDRGMTFEIPLDVPRDVSNAILHGMRERCGDHIPRCKIDLSPLLAELGEAFGYDPALLAEAKGETGRPGHSWTAYAHQKSLPMMIIWEAEGARMLLTANVELGRMAMWSFGTNILLKLRLIGDEMANMGWMDRAAAALSKLESERRENGDLHLPAGNVMVRIGQDPESRHERNRVVICTHEDGSIPENRKDAVKRLIRSATLVFTKPSEIWPDSVRVKPVPGFVLINRSGFGRLRMVFGPEEPIPQTMIQDFQIESAHRCLLDFNAELDMALSEPEVCDRQEMLEEHRPMDSIEARERRMKLRESMRGLLENTGETPTFSFSRAIWRTDGESLRGTGRDLAMRTGNVAISDDLIEMILWRLMRLRTREAACDSARARRGGGLRAHFDIDPARGAEADNAELQEEIVDLAKPYFSSHMGLPVRVSKSLRLWRRNDTEALAMDFYATYVAYENCNIGWPGHDPELINHVHLADLYKVPRKR